MNDQRYSIGISLSLSGNGMAVGLMLGYVAVQSLVPLFVALGGEGSPFIFNAAWRVGTTIGYALVLLTLLIVFRGALFSGEVWRVVRSRVLSLEMILWMASFIGLGLYAWSTQYIDVSIAAALYETWPIFLAFLTAWLFRSQGRYRRITNKTIFMFALAVLGMALVIASQAGGFGAFVSADTGGGGINLALGVALALGAILTNAFGALGFKWVADLASELSEVCELTKGWRELFTTSVGLTVCSLASLPFIALVGVMRNEPIAPDSMMYGATGGLLIWAVGTILWRMAILISSNLEINLMNYLTPLLALAWLFAFSQVGDVSVGYLLIGVAAIVLANLFMFFETRGGPLRLFTAHLAVQAQARKLIDIDALIAGGESETVEFKSTFWMSLMANKNDERVRRASLKTIAAFLNSRGGILIIGVADDGSPVGIDKETFLNEDGRQLQISDLVQSRMGQTVMDYVKLLPVDYKGVGVLAVICSRSDQPIYYTEPKAGIDEDFYVRSGPSSIPLTPSAQREHISRHFS